MQAETVETNAGAVEEEICEVESCLDEADMNEEHRMIAEQIKEIIKEGRTSNGIMFKKVNKKVLKNQTERVNEAIKYLRSKSITETNKSVQVASVWVAEQVGLKKVVHRKKNEPRWKRRIEGDIKRLKQDINFLERGSRGELGLKKKHKLSQLSERYGVKRKGLRALIEELKQRMMAKSAKIRRYEQRIEQFRQSRTFETDQKKIYAEFNGEGIRSNDVPDAEESKRFWGGIWSVEKEHNHEAE